jgi:hypothetical protein
MKLVVILFTLFELAQGVAAIALGFLVLLLLLLAAGLTVRTLTLWGTKR